MIKLIKVFNILVFICFVVTLFVQQNLNYQNIFLLPLSVLILNFFFRNVLNVLKGSFIFNLIVFQIIIRYALVPVLISNGGDFLVGYYSNSSQEAIFLMIFELLFVYICFFLVSRNYFRSNFVKSKAVIFLKVNAPTLFFLLICLLLLIQGNYSSNINVFWDFKNALERVRYEESIEVSSISGLIFPFFVGLLSVIFISKIELNVKVKHLKLILLILVLSLNMVFIVGVSRFSILFAVLPLGILISQIYIESRKKIFIMLLFLFIPVLAVTTISKMTGGDNVIESNSILNADSFNAYFAGVGNISTGLDSYNKINSPNHLFFLFNDLFQNVPLLSKVTDNTYKTNFVFNKEIYGHSDFQIQIVPLGISGLFHIGLLGIPFYAFLFSYLAFYFEYLSLIKKQIGVKYAFILMSFTSSLIFMINIGSMVSRIIICFVFILIPFYFLHKIQIIKKY